MLKPTPKERVLFVRRLTLALLVLVGVFCLSLVNFGRSPQIANAAAANTINFQARLQSSAGAIVPDGNYNIEFKIYSASTSSGSSQGSCTGDANCLWTETRTSGNKVQVINGYLSVNLGSVTAFSGINWDQQLWMTMNIGGTGSPSWDGEMSPRLTLTAVPYAFASGQLNTTNGSYRSTLSLQAPTVGNQTFVIQDQGAAGTYNLLTQNQNDARYIQLQGSTPGTAQTGNLNISGTGVFGTAVSTSQLTATGQTILGGGSNQIQTIIKANASQSAANPLLEFQDSSGSELARISISNNGDFFWGWRSGVALSGGYGSNMGMGNGSLQSLTTGSYNTGIGTSSLANITTTGNNVAIGGGSGNTLTGSDNVAIGTNALNNPAASDANVAVGSYAGAVSGAGANFYWNTFLGHHAGSTVGDSDGFVTTSNLHNAAAIGANAQVQSNNTIVLGGIGTNAANIVIGSTMGTGSNTFGVSPVVYNTGTASQSGSTITGTGTSWSTANGVRPGQRFIFANGTDGGTITAINSTTSLTVSTSQTVSGQAYRIHTIGFQVTNSGEAYIQGTSATAFKVQDANAVSVLNADTVNGQVTITGKSDASQLVVKQYSSQSANTPAIKITDSSGTELAGLNADSRGDLAFGYFAGGNVTSGSGQNAAFGSNALLLNTSGSVNTAFGALAGSSITSGSGNTALGYNAYAHGTANNNIAVGRSALTNIVGGDSNIGIGYSAGYLANGSTGSGFYQNTFIGFTSGSIDQDDFATVNTLHDAAAIGTYAQVQASNTLVLGGVNTGTAVNGSKQQQVVIGTTMPVSTNIFGVSPMVYNAGTASQTTSTITGSSTSWSTANGVRVGMRFIFADGTDAGTITAINSTTSLTVSTSQTVSSQKYRIHNTGFQIDSTGNAYLASTSSTAFQVQNAAGTNVLAVNTSTAGVTVTGNLSQSTGTISLTGNGASQISTSSGALTLDAATNVNVGTTNATGVTVGNTSNTSAFLVQGTAGATYTIGTSGNTGGITLGNSTDSNTIAIGNAATATGKIQTINIGAGTPAGTGKAVVTIGNESNASSVTLQSGTGSVNLVTNGGSSSTTGTIVKSDTNNSTAAFQIQNSSSQALFKADTSTGTITIGSSAGSGSIFLNNGATVNSTLALTDFATGGSIGSAATTVDVYTSISVNQTTASQTLTIPNPTASTTYGRLLYLSNIGSTNFTVGGFILKNGASATFVWSNTNGGASWQYAGADGASILNQNSADQTADFRISGTGRANTKFTSPLFDSITGALSLGTSTATGVTIGGTTNTATILLQGSTAATYTFGTSDNTGGLTLGNSTDSNTIAIGNAATATGKIQTINVGAGTPAGTGKAVVTIGNQSNASSVTLQSGTGNISLLTNGGSNSTTGTVVKSVTNNSTAAFQVQNASAASAFNVDTTNDRVSIGTSDTTGTLLVLDTKTNFTAAQTSDPTGVAGGMYFNSATGAFRCYEVDHWHDCLVSARSSYHRTFEMGTGGIDGSGGDGELISFSSGTGTLNSGEPGETGHPGIVNINVGSTAAGYNYIGSVGDNEILLGNNDYWRFETVLRLPTTLNALSTATQRYIVRAGFVEQSSTTDGADGCFFKYSDNVNSGNWQGICLSNSSSSTCDTGTAVALNTWYRLTTVVNAAGNSVDFRINGVSKCTVTTNIPTGAGRQTGRGVSMQKSVGTTDRSLDIDYEDIEGQFGTPR